MYGDAETLEYGTNASRMLVNDVVTSVKKGKESTHGGRFPASPKHV
jgi:hypothetical protein